jgi:hypothetical protein
MLALAMSFALPGSAAVHVAQVEAGSPTWQANPSAVSAFQSQMTWICGSGAATNFPNTLGDESGHANEVARLLYSIGPEIAQLDNYEASYFTSYIIPNEIPISAKIVNQSFAYFARNNRVDQDYDDYASKYNILFVSGAGNSGWVRSPGTAYNSISVGAYGGSSSIGPATDGRSKPDITAPAGLTSFSTPLVSGAASLLAQAGATDIRVLKALLLNGAQKPADWTNSPTAPLDQRYGAGILNVSNALRQFHGGPRCGWELVTVGSNEVRRHVFDVPVSTITVTLVWLRNYGCSAINNLDLSVRSETGDVVAASRSTLDNVEHLHLPNLPLGRYSLEVSSSGGDETYALAFDLGNPMPPRLTPWTLTGEPNRSYVIETTVDLHDWTPFVTNRTSAAGTFEFTPPQDAPARFFRAAELP